MEITAIIMLKEREQELENYIKILIYFQGAVKIFFS